jgi:hypothetical protein
MATWIAHLRIAEGLLVRIPDLDPAQFAIGNIAPDSGVPDERRNKGYPSSEVTHFKRSRSVHKDIADLAFYRDYLAPLDPQDRPRFSYRLGYFFHLITDNLWTVQVGKPTQDRFKDQFANDPKFIWEVKRDWYGLDHQYIREHPNCLYWRVFLEAEPRDTDLDFLPLAALDRQLNHIKAYYQLDNEEIQQMMTRSKRYLIKGEMDRFVKDAISPLVTIFNTLWPVPPELGSEVSALTLVSH